MLSIIALITACCFPASDDTTTTTTTTTTAAPPAATPEPPPRAAYPRADGAAYSGKWLIILASNKEIGQHPQGAATLASSDLEHELVTLDSSQFKALMPCYEVIVARAFSDRGEAIAYSRQLTAAGIDNYPKNAGAYVGAQPQVEAYCAGERAEVAAACPGQVRLLAQVDGRSWAHLGLDPAEAQPLLASAPAPRALDEAKTAWESPLSVQHAGPWQQGQAVTVYGDGSPQECTLTGFSVLTLGQPHFAWYDYNDDHSAPACGSPEIYAQLSCRGGVLMAPAGAKEPVVYENKGEQPSQMSAILGKLEGYEAFEAEVVAHADGREVFERHTLTVHEAEGREVAALHLVARTGEEYLCGGPDLQVEGVALVDLHSGEVLLPITELYGVDDLAVVDVDGDGVPEVLVSHFPSTTKVLGGGR